MSAAPAPPEPTRRQQLLALGRVLRMLRPQLFPFVVGTVALLVSAATGFVYPQAVSMAIDAAIRHDVGVVGVDQAAIIIAIAFALSAVLTWVRVVMMTRVGERFVAALRADVYQALLAKDMSWMHERPSGELTGRLAADVTTLQGLVADGFAATLREVATLVIGVALLLWQSPELTAVVLVMVPPVIGLALVFGRRLRRMTRALGDRLADQSSQVQETMSALATVQAATAEPREHHRYHEQARGYAEAAIGLSSWRGAFMAGMGLLGWSSAGALMWLGARAVARGEMTPGELTSFLMYAMMVAFSLGGLAGLFGSLQQAAGATQRLFAILEEPAGIVSPITASSLPSLAAGSPRSLSFSQLSFAYPARPTALVLQDIHLDIAAGERVAVVGKSGAGKTTLGQLAFRFFDPAGGTVRIDGIDIRELSLVELRAQLALVSQEPVLFSGTLWDNIRYAAPGASDDDVHNAARAAHAHDFITGFPDGYATMVGERGVKLSGGQRQRIAIARALLRNPRILVLDEATSNLDSESEAAVHQALRTLMVGRTTLLIAHRLSTVRDADRIVVMDAGRVVEQGSHDELLQQQGLYRTLVQHQL
jgi:ABC-type multidrug transport system fused ATPase/permease subunit